MNADQAAALPPKVARKIAPHESGCWLWTAALTEKGYGRMSYGPRPSENWKAHRFVYTRLVGPIPDGLTLDHLCRVPACVNPDHMDPVTHAENVRRGIPRNAKKTHCPQGHPYSPDNTYRVKNGTGRMCRRCSLDRAARKNRAAA